MTAESCRPRLKSTVDLRARNSIEVFSCDRQLRGVFAVFCRQPQFFLVSEVCLNCNRCGHDNPTGNRFCGMCGSALPRSESAAPPPPPVESAAPPRASGSFLGLDVAPRPLERPAAQRASSSSFLGLDVTPRSPDPPISGPSFLGLGRAGDSSSSYLLEDEEPASHWRGYLVALVVIAVAVLAALQWKAQVKTQAYKVGTILWARLHAPPPQPKVEEKTAEEPVAAPSPQSPSSATGAGTTGAAQPNLGTPPGGSAGQSGNSATAPARQDKPAADSDGKPSSSDDSAKDFDQEQPDDKVEPAKEPPPKTRASARQRQVPPEDDSTLLLAQKYLKGQGVPQNCQQGLSYLREAARKSSARARSQMGALYATGTCVPQSRVEAYRWFSSALEVDPRNPWLARERDSLYGEMTAAERRQVTP
jgi:hypothetical protein